MSENLWSWTGSNRRHPACKAGALPTELQPQVFVVGLHFAGRPRVSQLPSLGGLVGLGGLEPPTSRLSGARSSQLSYRPSGFPSQRPILSKNRALARPLKTRQQALDSIAETLTWSTSGGFRRWYTLWRRSAHRVPGLLRKEVIQPQVPLRLPCYDFTPVTDHSLGTSW